MSFKLSGRFLDLSMPDGDLTSMFEILESSLLQLVIDETRSELLIFDCFLPTSEHDLFKSLLPVGFCEECLLGPEIFHFLDNCLEAGKYDPCIDTTHMYEYFRETGTFLLSP